jgi:hypothetical protein
MRQNRRERGLDSQVVIGLLTDVARSPLMVTDGVALRTITR